MEHELRHVPRKEEESKEGIGDGLPRGHGAVQEGPVLTAAPAVDVSIRKEILVAVANLINAEEHLIYSLPKAPDRHVEDLKQLVAEIRSVRSSLMRAAGYGNEGGELWCAAKHILAASYRVLEAAEKASKATGASDLSGSGAVEMAAHSQELLGYALVLLEIQKEMRAREGGRT